MLDVRGFTYGLALGAGSMYLFDPQLGAARRARLRDSSRHIVRQARKALQIRTRDLENRTRGVGARASRLIAKSEEPLSEDVLVARVRSRLGRVTSHARAIEVRFKEGNEIELKGPALANEHDRIVRAAARVRGVDRIDDDLAVYEDADGIPGLQEPEGSRESASEDVSLLGLSPAAQLVLGGSCALLLVTPIAPAFVRVLLGAAVRALLEGAGPPLMRRREEQRSAPPIGIGAHP
ncbi:MAG: hypothetical protein JWO86_2822 [Myxococcaceae bacterium]|jgi:hypothetical protein|nr:hypothetical protein [Myxococcaceae bacterium]MEA2747857.1 hypothetical protein [Myxococcales bacterium]